MDIGSNLDFQADAASRDEEKEEMNDADVRDVVQNSFSEQFKEVALVQGTSDAESSTSGIIKRQTLSREKKSKMNRRTIRGKRRRTLLRKYGHRSAPSHQRKSKVGGKTAKIVRKGKKKGPIVEPTGEANFTSLLHDLVPHVFPKLKVNCKRDALNKTRNKLDGIIKRSALPREKISKVNRRTIRGKGPRILFRKYGHRYVPSHQRKVGGKTAKIVRKGKKKSPTVKPTGEANFTSLLQNLVRQNYPHVFSNLNKRDALNKIDIGLQLVPEAVDAIKQAVEVLLHANLAQHGISFGERAAPFISNELSITSPNSIQVQRALKDVLWTEILLAGLIFIFLIVLYSLNTIKAGGVSEIF